MSEQLFILNGKDEFLPIQKVGENVNSYLKASEVCGLLNEQQAKIERLQKENENLESNVKWFKHQFDKLKRFEDWKNRSDSEECENIYIPSKRSGRWLG